MVVRSSRSSFRNTRDPVDFGANALMDSIALEALSEDRAAM